MSARHFAHYDVPRIGSLRARALPCAPSVSSTASRPSYQTPGRTGRNWLRHPARATAALYAQTRHRFTVRSRP
jgi:hypothetical protein